MAKKKTAERGAKSAAIRAALNVGITKPSEIVAYAKRNGVDVKLGLVNSVKAQSKKRKPKKGKPGRKPKVKSVASRNGSASHGLLDAAAEFVRKTGGLDAAHSLLEKIKGMFGKSK